jgi:Adenylate and Guanylate cyclase catalytic domain/AAA ATPase domain
MALFGAPIAHEDHAVRACYAALAMQAALHRYSEEVRRTHGLAVHFRVGLNSGEVVVRGIDNDLHTDYSAIGQTVHLAARMEQLVTPDRILLKTATVRLVQGLVRLNTLGPVPVKGLAEPVEVFELVGATAVRQRFQAAARGLTRFVGREPEMTVLVQVLARARAGHGQLVAAVGETGVGKSRLLYEFVHSHRTQGWLALEAASVSYRGARSRPAERTDRPARPSCLPRRGVGEGGHLRPPGRHHGRGALREPGGGAVLRACADGPATSARQSCGV